MIMVVKTKLELYLPGHYALAPFRNCCETVTACPPPETQ